MIANYVCKSIRSSQTARRKFYCSSCLLTAVDNLQEQNSIKGFVSVVWSDFSLQYVNTEQTHQRGKDLTSPASNEDIKPR